jgi:hypothetical protein
MRDQAEIQKAHDVLAAVTSGATPIKLGGEAAKGFRAARDVLCWILYEEDKGGPFERNFEKIMSKLDEAGLHVEALPKLMTAEEIVEYLKNRGTIQ